MRKIMCLVVAILAPVFCFAESSAETVEDMNQVLENLLKEMIPLCEGLIKLGSGIAGFGALWFIALRVWKHIHNAEPVDFFPLFRPFVIGFCIVFFVNVLGLIDGILKPTVEGTKAMVKNSDKAVAFLLKEKEKAIKTTNEWKMYVGDNNTGDRERWYRYTHNNEDPATESMWSVVGNDIKFALSKQEYKFRNSVKEWMAEILQVIFLAASLCINTLRTFQLLVLAVIGPIVFGLSVFDGFQHTLGAWLAKYINVFLWLPIANLFGAIIGRIQENMLKIDLGQISQHGETFFSRSDTCYLIFMVIGIIGYFTVPSVSNFIINAGPNSAMLQKVTTLASGGATKVMQMGGRGLKETGSAGLDTLSNLGHMKRDFNEGLSGKAKGEGTTGDIGRLLGSSGAYMADRLSGKSSGNKS